MTEHVYNTEEECIANAQADLASRSEDYKPAAITFTHPGTLTRGYIVFNGNSLENDVVHKYSSSDKLNVVTTVDDPREWMEIGQDLILKGSNVFLCDDPKRLKLGFVNIDTQFSYYVSLNNLQECNTDTKNDVLDFSESLSVFSSLPLLSRV